MSNKLAVIFPGIGYHSDKPLLYYTRSMLRGYGYDEVCIDYAPMPRIRPGNSAMIEKCCEIGRADAEEQLKNIDMDQYNDIVFVGKSIGTCVGARYASEHDLRVRAVWYTPIPQLFRYACETAVIFHGTDDPWAENEIVRSGCDLQKSELIEIPRANHSLEVGDTEKNLEILISVLRKARAYILSE